LSPLQPDGAGAGTIAILIAYIAITSYQFKGAATCYTLSFQTRFINGGYFSHRRFVIVTTALAACRRWPTWMCHRFAGHCHLRYCGAHAVLQGRGWPAARHVAAGYFQALGNYRLGPDHVRQSVAWVWSALEFLVPVLLLMLGNQ